MAAGILTLAALGYTWTDFLLRVFNPGKQPSSLAAEIRDAGVFIAMFVALALMACRWARVEVFGAIPDLEVVLWLFFGVWCDLFLRTFITATRSRNRPSMTRDACTLIVMSPALIACIGRFTGGSRG